MRQSVSSLCSTLFLPFPLFVLCVVSPICRPPSLRPSFVPCCRLVCVLRRSLPRFLPNLRLYNFAAAPVPPTLAGLRSRLGRLLIGHLFLMGRWSPGLTRRPSHRSLYPLSASSVCASLCLLLILAGLALKTRRTPSFLSASPVPVSEGKKGGCVESRRAECECVRRVTER